jgi:O-antigen/teichoic acid export membrane protein
VADRKSIFANVSALAVGQIVSMALGFVTHAILARTVGPSDYGVLGFAIAVLSYFGIAASLGTDSWAGREIASHRGATRQILNTILSLRLALAVLSAFGVIVFIMAWHPDSLTTTMVLIQAISLFTAAVTLDFAFQGVERLDAVARRQSLSSLIALAGVTSVLTLGGGIIAASAMFQAAALISTLVMLWEFSRIAGLPRFSREVISEWRRILAESAPLAITVVVITVYLYIDIVMLGFLRPGAEVGHYVAATRILVVGLVVASVLRTAVSPVLTRLQSSPVERAEIGSHHARIVAAFGGLAAAGGFVLAPEILEIVFGAQFRDAASTLRILMVSLMFMNVVEVYHTQLVAWRMQTQQMWIMIAGAVFNVAINLVLIPRHGMDGAAFATLASTLLILMLAADVLRRNSFEIHAGPSAMAIGLAIAVGSAGWAIDVPIEGTLARFIVIGGALSLLYIGLALVLKIVRPAQTLRLFTRT